MLSCPLPVSFCYDSPLTRYRSYAKSLFIPPSTYGIGKPAPLQSFGDALDLVNGGRDRLVFVNNGFVGGHIEQAISKVSQPAKEHGDEVHVLSSEHELRNICRSSLRGVSPCIAAAVFYSSPTEGSGGRWNYSIRADGALGSQIDVNSNTNDQEVYLLPFQHSIDWAIANVNSSIDQNALPDEVCYIFLECIIYSLTLSRLWNIHLLR